ncbi:PAS domain-containing protein [Aureococcus anophagefferens]|nr:PAS domain-containing protein [Aureococcus anophagefferens]
MGSMAPQDADEWLSSFISFAETWPACIVVSDMTIPGAPMVYVNPEFCRVTEYPREEAVGRNCRFLQGPDTEPESIQVIQETLCKGEDCHVLLTNYRKSGDKFKNLLSMRPVYDADDVYRYTIGVQFEVEKDNSPAKLQQLNKLLQMLPKKLNLRSAKVARDRGLLAARTDGGANDALTAPTEVETHVQFAREAADVLRDDLESKASKKQLRKLHLRMRHNPIFYCTRTEIVIGDIDETAWEPIRKEVAWGLDVSTKFLAADLLPRVLRSETGRSIVEHTGYGPEQIGKKCTFLQGPETEQYLIDEIVDAARVQGPRVETATGENRDMYGKKLGEKHASALRKLNKSAWLTDADRSMRVLLGREDARAAFKSFLASEYNEQALDFYLEAQKLVKLAPNQQASEAQRLLDTYMGAAPPKKGSRGIGQQDRTKATSTLWDGAKKGSVKSKTDAYVAVQKEAQNTFKMLVVDSFPRFVQSSYAKSLGASLAGPDLAKVRDTDEWLGAFTQIAETWPACIVVSDMTIPGAPMVYVNPEFCRVTEYTTAEAVGRNCRFLQGPDTEPESIGVIQRTLGKCEDCHVLLTNYRKSGEKFKNLLSMRPVLDADDVYRFVIGVQFEVIEDDNLPMRLGQLDKLLRMLPKKLPVRGGTRKVEVEETRAVEMTEEHCVASMFATTKLKWLSKPAEAVRGLVSDPESAAALERFAASKSPLGLCAVKFLQDADALSRVKGRRRDKLARKLFMRMWQNPLFYCTTTEIVIGDIDTTDWAPILKDVKQWSARWQDIVGECCLRPFLDSEEGARAVLAFRERERSAPPPEEDEAPLLSTSALGLDARSGTFWLGMVDAMSASMADVGLVVSDMRKCSFLQGAETPTYLIEEIVDALRGGESLVVKLPNYKRDGESFQCLLTLKPVFDAWDKYSYCVGAQVDLTDASVPVDRLVSRLLRFFDSNAADDVWDSKSVASNEQKFVEPKHAKKSKKMKIRALKKEKALAQQMWLADSLTSLRSLIAAPGPFRDAFRKFLETEQADAELAFYLGVLDMRALDDADEAGVKAEELHGLYLADVGDGIGQQQRTKATQRLWTAARKKGNAASGKEIRRAVEKEAERTLQSLAFDAFPRFLKTDLCSKAMKAMKQSGGKSATDAALADNLEKMGSMAPQDADEWLSSFISFAETWPACIVVSDMTIPGAPMVYVNPEFCRVTEYPREEAVGRNCRFLQGPDTEPESIQVIQETLCKGEDCHVLLTNYRKSGDKFKNLLSMRPVYDADDVYRYTIGVQFEVEKDNSPAKLQQLNKLLQMLPKKLNLRSAKVARDRGRLAARTDGGANGALVAEKEERRHGRKDESEWAASIFALTRIRWLASAVATVRGLVQDAAMGKMLADFAAEHGSPLTQTHVQFAREAADVLRDDLESKASKKQLRKLHLRMRHNPIFYCTRTEIVIGDIDETAWEPIRKEVAWGLDVSTKFLAADLLPRVLRSETGRSIVEHVRRQEQIHETQVIHTCAHGVSTETSDERYWLDMFSGVALSLEDVGVVVSDMRVPGIPLVAINEPGFRNQTGYGPEQIGKKCTFLQGPETEQYLIDEIVDALRECKGLAVKLTNVKKDGSAFQCYLALHPVFGANGEYLYQVGAQVDMTGRPSDVCAQLKTLELLLQLLPSSILCRSEADMQRGVMALSASGDTSALALPSPPPVDAPVDADVRAAVRETVETATGENRDMYGKKLGEKHASALRKLNKSAWLTDADRSMRVLLGREDARAAFKSFLASEYNEQALDFYLEAQKLVKLAPNQQASEAQRLLDTYMGAAPPKKGSRGIGQQDRTKATSTLWDGAKKGSVKSKTDAYVAVQKEAQNTFKMLVVDSFPRFVQSSYAKSLGASLAGPDLAKVRDTDEWLGAFTQIAETWPACIVVSDMTIPGAPMVYVNPEFCRVTEYTTAEAVGRNCRFLQGPDTEPESIGVIQRTLGKCEDCHVLLTNYRKSGEKFKNLLSMRPVLDADDVYRFVIGVQFEVIEDDNLPMRLGQLDKLLRMLPKKLPVRGGTRKVEVEETRAVEMTEEHCVASMFATTKLKWLSKPAEAVRGLVSDPERGRARAVCRE